MEEKVICPYCFGLKCGFLIEHDYSRNIFRICHVYTPITNLTVMCTGCTNSCSMCKGDGFISWIDSLFLNKDTFIPGLYKVNHKYFKEERVRMLEILKGDKKVLFGKYKWELSYFNYLVSDPR